ncbi:Glycogen debranching enzyme [Gracilaria domingensis]|nr:Glycogen debranching enzyme [Gracilaria domingensis]
MPLRPSLSAINDFAPPMLNSDLPTDVVYVGREVCGELPMAEAREVLVTNGIGGYGSLTLAGSLSRSYHGLLVAALRPPLDRTLLLSKLCETVYYHDKDYYLSTDRRKKNVLKRYTVMTGSLSDRNRTNSSNGGIWRADRFCSAPPIWRNDGISNTLSKLHDDEVVTPAGFELMDSFRLEGTVPVFSYSLGDAVLEKRVWMKHGQNTVYVTYYLRRATEAIELRMQALVNHRNHHDRTSGLRPSFNYSANVGRNGSTVSVLFTTREHQETTLTMMVSRGTADLTNEWVRGFVLSEERMRGLPHVDDNLHAATFIVELPPGGVATFVATAESNASQLSLDGEAELAMQHAYERSLLQKFDDARYNMFQRRMEADDRLSCSESSPYSDSSRSALMKRRRKRRSVEPSVKQLVLAADQFIISRGGGRSVVAGFHWFTDWARDVRIIRREHDSAIPTSDWEQTVVF